MTENQHSDPGRSGPDPRNGVTILVKIVAARRFILAVLIISTLLAAGISFLLPKWYRSTTSLLPPKNQGGLAGLGGVTSLLKDFLPVSATKGLPQGGAYSYLALLNSRREMEMIVRRFDLFRVYDIDDSSMERALREFEANYDVSVSDEGTIGVSILDRDPKRAAEMVNYSVDVLNQLNAELGAIESRGNREFLEKRVREYQDSLHRAEENLRAYQEINGVVVVSDEARSAASSYVGLYAKRVEAEIDLGILRKSVGTENPVYEQKQMALQELTARLNTFPKIGMESLRMYRQVLIHQKILEVLLPLHEQARFEEAKDVPAVVVLDPAVPAERKARPVRTLIVLTAFVTALVLAVIVVLLRDALGPFLAAHPELRAVLGRSSRHPSGRSSAG